MAATAIKTKPRITPTPGPKASPPLQAPPPLDFDPNLEALLQELDLRVESNAERGRPDALLIHLQSELHRQRRCFLRLSGADPLGLTEAGALQRQRWG